MLILTCASLHRVVGTSNSSSSLQWDPLNNGSLSVFTENRYWHWGRNRFREEPSREHRGERPQPIHVISDVSYDTLTDTSKGRSCTADRQTRPRVVSNYGRIEVTSDDRYK
ncbi:hypothetical protein J6590_098392, partial [Homalodisca vitripennis]